ncbi:hypothetical protein [Nocardia testacea]|uniref:hypothetical protein n=1 Tax=Nocardia testacea TaxID=248551 RepID=UPI0012F62530|nr:hypothetical protein [Nocardia testacea]
MWAPVCDELRERVRDAEGYWGDGGWLDTVGPGLRGLAAAVEGIEIVGVPRNADAKGCQVLSSRLILQRHSVSG